MGNPVGRTTPAGKRRPGATSREVGREDQRECSEASIPGHVAIERAHVKCADRSNTTRIHPTPANSFHPGTTRGETRKARPIFIHRRKSPLNPVFPLSVVRYALSVAAPRSLEPTNRFEPARLAPRGAKHRDFRHALRSLLPRDVAPLEGRSSGSRIVRNDAPSQPGWASGSQQSVRRSSPVTATGSRRICTGFP